MATARTSSTGQARVGAKGRVTIPKSIRDQMDLSKGDDLLFRVTADGTVEVVPMARVPRAQAWFYSDEMQDRVERAEEDIRQGRTTRATSVKEAQEHLDRLKDEG